MPVVVPLLALGAAYLAIRGAKGPQPESAVSDADAESVDTAADSGSGSSGNQTVTTGIDWTPLATEMGGSIPVDFLLRWIQKESGGNPCSKGVWGGPWEAGIGQVYFDKDQRSTAIFGATLDQLRAACVIDSQTVARPLTDDEMRIQMSSLVDMATRYIVVAGGKLDALGETWGAGDILCLAKLYHALPVLCTTHLSLASHDGHASSWDDYVSYMESMSKDELIAFDLRAGYTAGHGAAPYYPIARLFANAQSTGRG